MKSKRLIYLIFLFLVCGISSAVSTYQTIDRADTYDYELCVANYKNICVDQICLTSSDRHCDDRCEKGAIAKCNIENND